jgi:hypothetical protein
LSKARVMRRRTEFDLTRVLLGVRGVVAHAARPGI